MGHIHISHLVTESRNPKTMNLDDMSIHEFLTVMNEEDALVPQRIYDVLPQIEKAVEKIVEALNQGGRLFYVGSGTSGRLGILQVVRQLSLKLKREQKIMKMMVKEKSWRLESVIKML